MKTKARSPSRGPALKAQHSVCTAQHSTLLCCAVLVMVSKAESDLEPGDARSLRLSHTSLLGFVLVWSTVTSMRTEVGGRTQQSAGFKGPAARHVLHTVAPAPQHQHGQVEALHVLQALRMALRCTLLLALD